MRPLIAITQVSLDGVMQAPGSPEEDPSHGFTHGGWAMSFADEAVRKVINEIIAGKFDLLLGRRTYDIWTSYWPHHEDHPIGQAFNRATKYVVTHRPDQLSWKFSRPIGGDIVDQIRQLKASEGPALHLWGSSEVLQTLIAADLVDEHRLWIFPIVLGHGKRLFEKGAPPRGFTLVASQTTPKGILVITYQRGGPIASA